ncbi:reverse transcriptase domain-containing protein [Tanacetum coccineum]
MPPKKTTTPMFDAAIKALVARSVADALAKQQTEAEMEMTATIQEVAEEGRRLLLASAPILVFHISNYTIENQVKFTTCTLIGVALTWWNSYVKTVGHYAAYGMPWKTLMKMMTNKYCPRSEIKKLEIEIWNLKVKGTDVVSYIRHFQELALMCGRMFPEESDQVEKYVGGLPDMIQGSVMASKPKTMQEAIEIANDLMDQKVRTFAERQAENKIKLDNNSSDNNTQQQPPKKQNVERAYSAGPSEKKEYAGTLPLCNKCKFHHNGPCTIKHYKSDCLELKNQNHGNQARGTEARGMVYDLGGGETDQDFNNMEDDINA